MAIIAEVNRDPKKKATPFEPKNFMNPNLVKRTEKPVDSDVLAEQLRAAFGENVKIKRDKKNG